ncbi:hypothetical protein RI054_01g02450 [Pseudoscourfieldia marina]
MNSDSTMSRAASTPCLTRSNHSHAEFDAGGAIFAAQSLVVANGTWTFSDIIRETNERPRRDVQAWSALSVTIAQQEAGKADESEDASCFRALVSALQAHRDAISRAALGANRGALLIQVDRVFVLESLTGIKLRVRRESLRPLWEAARDALRQFREVTGSSFEMRLHVEANPPDVQTPQEQQLRREHEGKGEEEEKFKSSTCAGLAPSSSKPALAPRSYHLDSTPSLSHRFNASSTQLLAVASNDGVHKSSPPHCVDHPTPPPYQQSTPPPPPPPPPPPQYNDGEREKTVAGDFLRLMNERLGVPTIDEAINSKNGLTPDWIMELAIFDVMRLPLPQPGATCIRGLLDPCTNNKARPNIPAEILYDKSDNGLLTKNKWDGYCILLNPEYKCDVQWRFVNRALDEVENGRCPMIILLCRNSTDTAYYRRLLPYPRILLQRSKVRFKDYERPPIGWGTALFCLVGPACTETQVDVYKRFYQSFSPHGEASIPVDMEFVQSSIFCNLLERLRKVANETTRDFWIQCSVCGVWRMVPPSVVVDAEHDDNWNCSKLPNNKEGCDKKTSHSENRGNLWQLYAPHDTDTRVAERIAKGISDAEWNSNRQLARSGRNPAGKSDAQSGEHSKVCGCTQCRFFRAALAVRKSARRVDLLHSQETEAMVLDSIAQTTVAAAKIDDEEASVEGEDARQKDAAEECGATDFTTEDGINVKLPSSWKDRRPHPKTCDCLACQYAREAAACRGCPARLCSKLETVRAAQMAVNRIAFRLFMRNDVGVEKVLPSLGLLARQWQDGQILATAEVCHAKAKSTLDKERTILQARVKSAKEELDAAEYAFEMGVASLESSLSSADADLERARQEKCRGESMWSEAITRAQQPLLLECADKSAEPSNLASWVTRTVVSRKRKVSSTWNFAEIGKPLSSELNNQDSA